MKKKLFVGFAAAALAAVMCVSFAACGESGGAGKAKSVKGEEVTEEQWDAAFDALLKEDAKFTIEYSSESTTSVESDLTALGGKKTSGTYTYSTSATLVNNADKQYKKSVVKGTLKGDFTAQQFGVFLGEEDLQVGSETDEEYAQKETSGYTEYNLDEDGKWVKVEGAPYGLLYYFSDHFQKGNFSRFKYDETLKGYVNKDYEPDDSGYAVYKFNKDGQLVAIYEYYMGDNDMETVQIAGSSETSLTFSYTAKELTIPTVE